MSSVLSDPSSIAAREQSYLRAIEDAVRNVAGLFWREPASFLFETDLRAVLFTRLFDALAAQPQGLVVTDPRRAPLTGKELTVNPVKGECDARASRRFDIALLRPEPLITTDLPWTLPVSAAIEVKYWQAGEVQHGLDRDFDKLEGYALGEGRPFTGVALAFSHRRCAPGLLADRRIRELGPDPAAFAVVPNQVTGWVIYCGLTAMQ